MSIIHRLPIFAVFAAAACLGCGRGNERVPSRVVVAESEEPAVVEVAVAPPSTVVAATPESDPEMTSPEPMESSAAPATATGDTPATAETDTSVEPDTEVELPRLYGRITVTGTPPELPPIAAGALAANCNVAAIPNEAIVVGPDGGLANCIIYLKAVPDGVEIPPLPEEPLVVDQKGCQFSPHVSFGRVGQLFIYRNSDDFAHNVRSAPFRNEAFSITTGPGGELEQSYTQAETRPMQIKCDIHVFMTAYQAIFDHPWCAITDENGNFEISGLPEGELEFVAWHEKKGYIERSFKLQIDAASDIERNYEIAASELAD